MVTPPHGDLYRLAVEAMADIRTVRKAYAGKLRPGLAFERNRTAAIKLGFAEPPKAA